MWLQPARATRPLPGAVLNRSLVFRLFLFEFGLQNLAIRAAVSSCGPNCASWAGSWAGVPVGRCPAAAVVLWLARVSVRLPIRWACVCLGLRGFRGALAGRDDVSVRAVAGCFSAKMSGKPGSGHGDAGVGMPACWGCSAGCVRLAGRCGAVCCGCSPSGVEGLRRFFRFGCERSMAAPATIIHMIVEVSIPVSSTCV